MKTAAGAQVVLALGILSSTLTFSVNAAQSDEDRNRIPDAASSRVSSRWQAGELIVKFREASDPRITQRLAGGDLPLHRLPAVLRQLHAAHPVSHVRPLAHPAWKDRDQKSGLRATYVFQFSDERLDVRGLARLLSKDENIEYAEPNYLLQLDSIPNDPYFSSFGSWGQPYDDQWGLKLAHVTDAWDSLSRTNEVVVAVVDSGIDSSHPDLVGRIATNGWNFVDKNADPTDTDGHGTFVAGIIAATVNNSLGIAGIVPNVKILPLKVVNLDGRISTDNAALAVEYAVDHGARVINLSFSQVESYDSNYSLERAIRYARDTRAVVIASAGNNATHFLPSPASDPNVICVGATDHQDQLADFSNFGPRIDVVAPGGDSGGTPVGNSILSLRAANTSKGTPLNDNYTRWRGTSFAAPFVAGVTALMRAQWPYMPVDQFRPILRSTADDVMAPGWDWQTSYGRVNALAALQRNSAVVTRIEAPGNFQYVKGIVPISGSAGGTANSPFRIESGAGWVPASWALAATGTGTASHTALGNWNSTNLPDGPCSVRVTSFDDAGFKYEDRVALFLNNVEPPYHRGWPQPAGGANCTAPVMADLNGDGKMEILWGKRMVVVVKQNEGATSSEWPILESPTGPPSVADLDGDGYAEIGIISQDWWSDTGQISLWRSWSSPVKGWPKKFHWRNPFAARWLSPVFADLDGDGFKEIIWFSDTTNQEAVIHVDRIDGTPLRGWPVTLSASVGTVFSPAAVGDVDGDGSLDLVVMTDLAPVGGGYLYLFHQDGTVFPNWPVKLLGGGITASPALADVDHDGQLEIFAETYEGYVSLYKSTGELMPGWPKRLNEILWPPAFADLDGDGQLEIVVGNWGLYVLRADGSLFPGFPQAPGGWLMPPVIADLDGDGRLEIASSDSDGYVRAWDTRGNELYRQGFPIKATTDTCYSGPALGDVDGNGRLELVVYGTDNSHLGTYDLWDLDAPAEPSRVPFPTMLGDNAHQSRYAPPPTLTSVSPPSAISDEAATFTVHGDFFLKGMRVLLGATPQPVQSESVTSVTFTVTVSLAPGSYDVTVSNVNSSSATLAHAVTVITRTEAMRNLIATVDSASLPRANRQPLLAALEAATAALNRGNPGAASNILSAFERQVRAQVAPLDPALAERLIASAEEILTSLARP